METKKCTWRQDDDFGGWDTSCGQGFNIEDGTPSENGMKFCPFCGVEIEEVPWFDNEDDSTFTENSNDLPRK